MAFDFADAKNAMRRAVHDTLGVSALYYATPSTVTGVAIKTRWQNKAVTVGDLDNADYAQVETGEEILVFSAAEATTVGLARGGKIVIPQYQNIAFLLHEPMPADGPFEIRWQVSRK